MPRGERPLPDDGGVLTRFAQDLRALRRKTGNPPYRKLAGQAHYSSTTLADAASGQKLPSLAVTLAYVRACGGDPAEWEARWRSAAAELAAGEQPEGGEARRERSPYAGLAAFQPEDAEWFFGRERLTEDLAARLTACRFTAVFGASGSGKSSLLRAGLLPRIRDDAGWPVLLMTPGPHPLEECAARLAAFGVGSAAALHSELRDVPRALHLSVLQALADHPPRADLLIMVDQFEEVFTLCEDPAERAGFIAALVTAARAANSRTRVVLGVRADFYAQCSGYPELVEALTDAQVLVGPMAVEELRRAITSPASHAGCAIEGALLARVIADATGQANALPLVSHALRETWRRRRGNTLTLAGYEAAGGIQHALAQTAENVFTELTADQQNLARGVFLRLVALGDGTDDTKRPVRREDLYALGPGAEHVLDALARARLVTLDTETAEITHEALLHAWPRLRGWIAEDRTGLLTQQRLTEATAIWYREHRDPGLLYRGNRLAAAIEWAGRHHGDALLSGRVGEFLSASERQEHRTVVLRRAAIAVLAGLTLLASGTAAVAFQQRVTAQAARDWALSEQVTTEAQQVHDSDPSLAAQLDLAAYRIRPTREATTGLLDSQNTTLSTPLTGHTQAVYAVAFSPDGRVLATGSGDDTIRMWSLTDPAHPTPIGRPLTGHSGWVYWLQFSPDGHTLASASRDRTVRLWDVTDPAHPKPRGRPLTGHAGYAFSVSFSADGHTLATAGDDRTVRLWNVTDPAHAAAIGKPLDAPVASAAYSPDGRTVAGAGHDHTVRLWNVTDPRHPRSWGRPLTGHTSDVYAVAFSPDSGTLASVSNDRTVRLWDVTDPAHAVPIGNPLTGHTNTILAVAFSPDGRTLATGAADHTIRLWDVTDRARPAAAVRPLTGHTGFINWLAFGPDGHTLASAGDDHTVRLWHLPTTALTGHTGPVNAIAYSADGRTLASGADDHAVRLWNTADPAHPRLWRTPLAADGRVTRVAFSPHSRVLAAADEHSVRLSDIQNPAHPRPLASIAGPDTDSAGALAFHPRSRVLVADGDHYTLRLWDISDPTRPTPLGAPLTGHISPLNWAGFSPDGRILASASEDYKIRLWDTRDPAHPRTLPPIITGDTGGTLWGAFTGRILATGGVGGTIRLWNIADPRHVTAVGPPLTGHTGAVNWVGFRSGGRTLASAGDDHTMRLWDVSEPAHATQIGRPLTAGHSGPITNATYSPDGRTLASAGDDRLVTLTSTDLAPAVARICATARQALNAHQWHEYVPELPYRRPCR